MALPARGPRMLHNYAGYARSRTLASTTLDGSACQACAHSRLVGEGSPCGSPGANDALWRKRRKRPPKVPLGEGGEHLHDWMVELKAWSEAAGMEAARRTRAAPSWWRSTNVGAEIMGRGKFGPAGRGPWATIRGAAGGARIRPSIRRRADASSRTGPTRHRPSSAADPAAVPDGAVPSAARRGRAGWPRPVRVGSAAASGVAASCDPRGPTSPRPGNGRSTCGRWCGSPPCASGLGDGPAVDRDAGHQQAPTEQVETSGTMAMRASSTVGC
jgi:hypothetical protein